MRLKVDYENPSQLWWESGGRELWEGVAESFDAGSVAVEESIAASWLEEAARLPGWSDGPEYAPHPVVAVPLAEDEPE